MIFHQPALFEKFGIPGYFGEKIPKNYVEKLKDLLYFPRQSHSNRVIIVENLCEYQSGDGDGVISVEGRTSVGIQTADCVPILIADKGGNLFSAVHAGWRGTLKGILFNALQEILALGFCPEEILICIGPHIQVSCYEVKEDTLVHLMDPLRGEPYVKNLGSSLHLNLSALNLHQAELCGIPKENIWVSPECTHCKPERYHSYRREKNYLYTQISLIGPCEIEDITKRLQNL
ncbi:MAG: polyphenol oxidase family protein [Caldimicrobium sp.]|nr:polyphenol oxidase family protein [Caldimicrobium sp.]MCX7613315.1 polyphenol oxidase family protein [Caldimicrobium sp.]MDW8183404.1 polyphenol oxidase family protein [Caldimicrobium sp.]